MRFRVSSTLVTEVSWQCTNSNNENVQERARETTTTLAGVFSSVGRLKNQITGFNLTGYAGTPTVSSSTDGPPLNSCPSGPWQLTTPAGDPQVVEEIGDGIQVKCPNLGTNPEVWRPLVTGETF